MKAAILTRYDKSRRDLELRDVPVPEPVPGEVLVKVAASGSKGKTILKVR